MSIGIRFHFLSDHSGYNEILNFIEDEDCVITGVYTTKIDQEGPAVMENCCKAISCVGPGTDTIRERIREKFPGMMLE